ncbi:MAG: 2-hydroxychromene-2-carboxylate isomerase [Burkholderiales bacterium]|nr:2-hydroxychromene-2-carboxylate isomerase [Burkholderiales bacterium]
MKRIEFFFDFVSPFAYLAFERLPQALEGCSYVVEYRPVLFAGLLQHWGQKGPAELDSKRAWTFRHTHWLAHRQGTPMQTPAVHPFNPLALLRLAIACDASGPNRFVVEQVFRHVWASGGADAVDPARLAELAARLAPARDPASDDVKRALREATEHAIALGVFGVPSYLCEGRLFWGLDALPMLRAAIAGDPWFDGPAWEAEGRPRAGIVRR